MYARIFSQIYDSSIAEDYQVRHVFMDLLVLADRTGIVDMTVEAIARRTNVPIKIIRKALLTLLTPDPSSRSKEEDGRRVVPLDNERDWGWQIVNFSRYHSIKSEDAKRAYMKAYMRKRRAKKKLEEKPVNSVNINGKPVNQGVRHVDVDVDVDVNVNKDTGGGFETFWQAYPSHKRRPSRTHCQKIWKRKKLDAKLNRILEVLEAEKKSDQWTKDDGQYIKHMATWLNQDSWEDDIADIQGAFQRPDPALAAAESAAQRKITGGPAE